jgi:hypothetical protein
MEAGAHAAGQCGALKLPAAIEGRLSDHEQSVDLPASPEMRCCHVIAMLAAVKQATAAPRNSEAAIGMTE